MTTTIQMRNKVLEIWKVLESENELDFVKRLYTTDSNINVYCIYQSIDKYFGIALSYPENIKVNLTPFSTIVEPLVEIYVDTSFPGHNLLCAKIKNHDKINEFSYLCENIIQNIISQPSISEAVKTFGNALLRWKNLFEQTNNKGLSKEEQQGLYGELRFLQKCLAAKQEDHYETIQNYVGTNHALRDFQGKDWAVEVKTTTTNNPQVITINGERQLDDSMIDELYLYHCSIEASNQSGESLPELVNEIRKQLESEVAAYSLFNAKLFEAGYHQYHESIYNARRYKIRKDNFYRVNDKFPRIKESELREGVGNVKYTISISSFENYKIAEELVIEKCISHD